jgi:hypothetical protein
MAKIKKVAEEQLVEDTAPVTDASAVEVPDSITLVDLQLLLNIIDLSTSRGAFRGSELTQVGAVFDKLNKFLSYVAAQQQKAQEEQAAQAA